MKLFNFKTVYLTVFAAVSFTLMSFAYAPDVSQNLGQANEVTFAEGQMAAPNEATMTKAVTVGTRWLLRTVREVYENTCRNVLHDASLAANGDPNDAQTVAIRQKALDARMSAL